MAWLDIASTGVACTCTCCRVAWLDDASTDVACKCTCCPVAWNDVASSGVAWRMLAYTESVTIPLHYF